MADPASLSTTSPKPDLARLAALVARTGHNRALGIRPRDQGADWCELALDFRDELIGDTASGVLASGPILTLMDMATSMAVWLKSGRFRPQATLDLRIDYRRAAVPGRTVIGRGTCDRITRRIAFVHGLAHDGDPADPVATVAGTFMFTDAA
jgi:uncharacterized protein (TIGR00369 family)